MSELCGAIGQLQSSQYLPLFIFTDILYCIVCGDNLNRFNYMKNALAYKSKMQIVLSKEIPRFQHLFL